MMTSAGKDQAARNANRIRELVASTPFQLPGRDDPVRVTISGGVATFPEDGESTSELIRAADEALYAAKGQGRNRIVTAARIGLDGKPY
jgi:two-component system cell cycle response regulator